MPIHRFEPPRGRIETLRIESAALYDNLLGDPTLRTVAVYLPEGYDESGADLPLFVYLAGFTGSGLRHLSWQSFGESLPQRIDRLLDEERIGPLVMALPDAFTSLGGNQYVNSFALGHWEDFLLHEMIPEIERRFRVRADPHGRAVLGKSSGGYGALVQAMRHGEHWGAAACHSGDMGFEIAYRRDFPIALSALAKHEGDPRLFVEHLREAQKVRGEEMHALMLLAMSASYDPDPEAPFGIRLPVDPHTCDLVPERWEHWLAHDPLRMVARPDCQESLGRLKGLFVDCGARDQYHLQYPARAFSRALEAAGVEHVYEEFDDTHSGIDYRLDRSLPYLYEAVTRR